MSSRDDILASIRANLPRVDRPLPYVPAFDDDPPASLLDAFKVSLHRMGGVFLDPPAAGDILAPVRAKIAGAKIVCSMVPEITGNQDIADLRALRDLRDVDFAIVRTSFAVAETGSLLLSDADPHVNAVAYLAQHLIVLLDPADIVINLHHAYRRPEFRDRHYASFHTGPSATADIEGVLIHGAQGARSPSCRSRALRAAQPREDPNDEYDPPRRGIAERSGAQQRNGIHRRRAPQTRIGRAAATCAGKPRPAGRAGAAAPRRKAHRSRTLHLFDRPLGPERDAVLPHADVRSGAVCADRLRPDGGRCLSRLRSHLPAGA